MERYCLIDPKTLQVLCETKPHNHRCYEYLAETIFNPFTGRNPIGSIKVYDTMEQANTEQKRHPKMIIAGYNTSLNHIYKI
jgi:hypothetical protein